MGDIYAQNVIQMVCGTQIYIAKKRKLKVMNSLQKRAIARLAYEEISAVINKWESLGNYGDLHFCAHWDGCITVDDELFHERQIMKNDK